MSEIKIPEQFEQKPLEQVVEDIQMWRDSIKQPVWFAGHGTPYDAADFFDKGLLMGRYNHLSKSTVPLDTENTAELKDTLDHWKHRDLPHVVLIAAQAPHKRALLGERHEGHLSLWMDGLIQRTQEDGKEQNFIPTDWIMGVYDRESGNVTLNPHFTGREVTAADMENSGASRYAMYFGKSALDGFDMSNSTDIPEVFEYDPDAYNDPNLPLVW